MCKLRLTYSNSGCIQFMISRSLHIDKIHKNKIHSFDKHQQYTVNPFMQSRFFCLNSLDRFAIYEMSG